MYLLKDFIIKFIETQPSTIVSDKIYCYHTNAAIITKAKSASDFLGFYSFNLIQKGSCVLHYNSKDIRLQEKNLYISSPGMTISLSKISLDYEGISLLVDEKALFESPIARKILQSAFIPLIYLADPVITLGEPYFNQAQSNLQKIIQYLESPILFNYEALYFSFSLFLLDLFDYIESKSIIKHPSINAEKIFIQFIDLLSKNYKEQHQIGFYAKNLNVTTTYLSRIVKKLTKRTVKDYISRMLLMEAVWILKTTNLSIGETADKLNFINQSSFCKFFKRMKGISPKDFR